MEHYITLFDSQFLPQGLSLHSSLRRHAGEFTLWVLCIDEHTKTVLDSLGEPTIRTIALAEVETPELLEVKPGRTRAEYCWTLTPFTPTFVFERAADAVRATYIDADVFLLRSPRPIFEEFERSGKAVLITDHAYDAEFDQSEDSGQYCVQFMVFERGACEPVRQWWQDRCIEWCFHRAEDGKLGDQKYLDDWPTRFGGLVHVLSQLDLLLAPWNARRFPYSRAVAWHFQGLRLLANRRVLLHAAYPIPEVVHRMVYRPYIEELAHSLGRLGNPVIVQRAVVQRSLIAWFKSLGRSVLGFLREVRNYQVIQKLPD